MISFDFEDNPFKKIREEMDQCHSHYSKLEFVLSRASKRLGNCKPTTLHKEIEEVI